ncbi:GNAT family N-acetyltransferase [Oleomonas cavernae]|uniref:GNAT family N-acetyltransferase n=1 Tax=Oleomonas cavernae TaxID=2320859 RepID=UPI001313F43B|nr:GNAT family N-acetyltransferase [Oleomonas cavernae]
MSQPIIRPAQPDDVAALADLIRALNIYEGDRAETVDAGALAEQLFGQAPAASAFVAADAQGNLVGYAIYSDAYDGKCTMRVTHLNDLFVTQAARGFGLGRSLVAAVARAGRARGAQAVWWTSLASNARAHAFYDKLGASRTPIVAHWLEGEAFERLIAG